MDNETKYYNAFNLIGEIGPARFKKLSGYFNNLKNAWDAGKEQLLRSGIEEFVALRIISERPKISPDAEWEKLAREKISVVTVKNAAYPKLLKEIYAPPAMLYVRGELAVAGQFPIAVVGSRRISSYGKEAAEDIVSGLAKAGATIVSGMAFGVDTAAHEAAIKSGGRTMAVLGSGLDWSNLSPRKRIADEIILNGAIVSEYPFGMPALKHHFPMRNRLIAGLSLGVLVVEAAKESGALITAKMALEENREVFAIPGSIYSPNSEGANNLIKSGAKAITRYQEILEELDLTKIKDYINNRSIVAATPEEEAIMSLLGAEPLHIDIIAQKAGISAAKISGSLMLMEMKGLVKNLGGENYTTLI